MRIVIDGMGGDHAPEEIVKGVVAAARDIGDEMFIVGDPAAIRVRMSELNAKRAEKQPLDVPSAGSTFKRPEGYYAAALIDQCGLKGYSVGDAMVSMKHAGFLVNTGKSSADFKTLMDKVQSIVEQRAGVKLEPEIRILGEEERA